MGWHGKGGENYLGQVDVRMIYSAEWLWQTGCLCAELTYFVMQVLLWTCLFP